MLFADNTKPPGIIEIEEQCERIKQNKGLKKEKHAVNIVKKLSSTVEINMHSLYALQVWETGLQEGLLFTEI